MERNKAADMIRGLTHIFYPRLCEGCNKPLLQKEEVLCLSCSLQLPKTTYHNIADNETFTRFAGRVSIQHATSLAYFTNDGLLQHLLHGLKYNGKKDNGIYLGKQLGHELMHTDWILAIDLIVPVPLHKKKEAQRGYNQSTLIANGIAEVVNKPALAAIARRRHTETQTHKTREQRVLNMQDAFEITIRNAVEGKHVLLVDDVLTTGATLESCANVLIAANARVSIATIGIV
jgi:ComF family protein